MWQENAYVIQTVESELNPDETLLWSGHPQKGVMFQASDLLFIPFSLIWGGFAIFWESMAIASHTPFIFKLWGIPFVLIGLYMIVGRFFVDAAVRAKTVYAVTSQRVLIITQIRGRQVQTLPLKQLPVLSLNERGDGSGTVTFGSQSPFQTWGQMGMTTNRGAMILPRFDRIPQARQVYDIIQRAQQDTA